jgi:sarcosine/dimethylglycine N-methyltransferase
MSNDDSRETRLLHALESELANKPSDYRFTAAELGMIDQIHTRGYANTVEFAHAVEITHGMHVLDLGAGLGGPARYLAETYRCRVEGVDATAGVIPAANYLSSRWIGPNELVTFTVGDALSIPFPDESFDLVWTQHVAMNVADRDRMYREIRRVLRRAGRLATYDVLRVDGELIYPTPWAADGSASTVLTGDETRDAVERAGLRVVSFSLDTAAALAWVRTTAAPLPANERPPGALMLRAALGENFREIVGNLGRNYLEGRADVAAIIARRE